MVKLFTKIKMCANICNMLRLYVKRLKMRTVDELRGTPEGYTAKSKHSAKSLKSAAVALSAAALSLAPLQAEAKEADFPLPENTGHNIEYVNYAQDTRNKKTVYDASVEFGVMPSSDMQFTEHKVSENTVETRNNGEVKTEYSDVSKETTTLSIGAVKVKENQTTTENNYYSNGNLKSEEKTVHEHVVIDPTDENVAQGHTEAHEYQSDKQINVTMRRNGDVKATHVHSSYSSNAGAEIRTDMYYKGDPENPTKMMEARLLDSDITDKVMHLYNANQSTEYIAKIENDHESYKFTRNNKKYDINVNAEGEIGATKSVIQRDGDVKVKEMGDLSSKIMLDAMHRKADKTVNKIVDNANDGAQNYFDSVNMQKANIGKLGDYFEARPDNFAEIQAQVIENAEQKFEAKTQVTANDLMQQKMHDSKTMAEKTGRGWQHRAAQQQAIGVSKENVATNTGASNQAINNAALTNALHSR